MKVTNGKLQDINEGGLFDLTDDRQEVAFRYAVDAINSDRTLLAHARLSAQIEEIPPNDSFRGSRKVCSLLKSGVAAIFGPQSGQTSDHVQSICDALEIPHIENRWDFRLTRDAYSVNLYPHPSTLTKAYMDVLKTLGWHKFCVIYENNNGLVRIQELLKNHTWEGTSQRPTHDTAVVSEMDLHTVDLEDFRHGGTNVTALRIVDPENQLVQRVIQDWVFGELRYGRTLESHSSTLKDSNMTFLKTEVALMYDAVQLFAKALDDLDRSRHIGVTPLECDGDITWVHGNSLINYMKWGRHTRGRTFMGSPASVGDVYGSPASVGDVYGSPASVGDVYRSPASVGDVYGSPASVGDVYGSPASVGDVYGSPASVGDVKGSPSSVGDVNRPPASVETLSVNQPRWETFY
nr:glutamate receptor ionotropic, kainate 3-like [Cherax quadricarinatus]